MHRVFTMYIYLVFINSILIFVHGVHLFLRGLHEVLIYVNLTFITFRYLGPAESSKHSKGHNPFIMAGNA